MDDINFCGTVYPGWFVPHGGRPGSALGVVSPVTVATVGPAVFHGGVFVGQPGQLLPAI